LSHLHHHLHHLHHLHHHLRRLSPKKTATRTIALSGPVV